MPNWTCKKGPVSVFDLCCFQLHATFNVNMGQQRSYVYWKTVTPQSSQEFIMCLKKKKKKLLKGDLYLNTLSCVEIAAQEK